MKAKRKIKMEIKSLIPKLFESIEISYIAISNESSKFNDGKEVSGEFLKFLSKTIKNTIYTSDNQKVFCKGILHTGIGQFNSEKIQEFLFDIHVVELSETHGSVKKDRSVFYVSNSLLQLESEFAYDTSATMIDASKLLCGRSEIKVMIVPATPNENNYLDPLLLVASKCQEPFLVFFVPSPQKDKGKWDGTEKISGYQYLGSKEKSEWLKL
jgi:hypothetical protein